MFSSLLPHLVCAQELRLRKGTKREKLRKSDQCDAIAATRVLRNIAALFRAFVPREADCRASCALDARCSSRPAWTASSRGATAASTGCRSSRRRRGLRLREFFADVDALILGRGTYDTALGFPAWPYGDKRCVVLTHGSRESRHGERFHAGAPVAGGAARGRRPPDLRRRRRGDSPLPARGADRRHHASIVPILLGDGIPLFDASVPTRRLRPCRQPHFPSGLVQLRTARTARESALVTGLCTASRPSRAASLRRSDAMVDARRAVSASVEAALHLVGKRRVLHGARDVDLRAGHARRQQVRAVRRVVREVRPVKRSGGRDAIRVMARRRQREPAAHAVPGRSDPGPTHVGSRRQPVEERGGVAHGVRRWSRCR